MNDFLKNPLFWEKIPLFAGLHSDAKAVIAGMIREQAHPKGAMIFQEGDGAKGFYVVGTGKVKIFKATPDGKEKILHIFGAGEPFGEVAMFAGSPFPASAQALEASRLLFLPRESFVAGITKSPALALSMLGVLSQRLRAFTVQIEQLSLKEVPARLAAYLATLQEETGGEGALSLPVSKAQLASLIGTSPETLSRILTRMVAAGLIDVEGTEIRILDPAGLKDVVVAGKMEG